ncbi:MAG: SpoIID/LytB domain-containing protein, partial [Myxococcaceae bacterium]
MRFALPGLLILLLAACVHRPAETPAPAQRVAAASTVVITETGVGAPVETVEPVEPVVPVVDDERQPSTAAELELPPPPGTDQAALYSKRLNFHEGDPIIPVRLMEGQREVVFSPRGPMRVKVSGRIEKTVQAPAGSVWRARVTQGEPAKLASRVQLAEFRFVDREGLSAAQHAWEARGIPVEVHTLGSVYGIAGKVIDNRSNLLLLAGRFTPKQAAARQNELLRQHGARTSIFEELRAPSSGIVELFDATGAVIAVGQDRLDAETLDGAPIQVRQVEYGVGYDFHSFEDRTFRGAIRFTIDRQGLLAVVNLVKIEDLLRGLVPSEIFARAHEEALKAQAVTARGEVLAKVGTRHLADPYLLCSEQHCAVYKGLSGEVASTNAAVEETHGEALFSKDGRLVDSVYSAVCGGHTEDNDVVWGGVPNPSLRGKPELILPRGTEPTP